MWLLRGAVSRAALGEPGRRESLLRAVRVLVLEAEAQIWLPLCSTALRSLRSLEEPAVQCTLAFCNP